MGFGGISVWQLLIILVIVALIFGTARLRNIGGDLGSALKSFRKAIKDEDEDGDQDARKRPEDPQVIDQTGQTKQNTSPTEQAEKHAKD